MDAPKTSPLRPRDGTAEKKPPIVQPEASPAPYPMRSPPIRMRAYTDFCLGHRILKSPEIIAAMRDPIMIPPVSINPQVN